MRRVIEVTGRSFTSRFFRLCATRGHDAHESAVEFDVHHVKQPTGCIEADSRMPCFLFARSIHQDKQRIEKHRRRFFKTDAMLATGYSQERLIGFLTRLGMDVVIVVRSKAKKRQTAGLVSVVFA